MNDKGRAMKTSRKIMFFTLVCVAWLAASSAHAQYRVDDTGSRAITPVVKMEWDRSSPSGGVDTVSGTTQVSIVLHVAPWKGRNAKITMELPHQPFGQVEARWITRGVLQEGQLIAGQSGGLVYMGRIETDVITDTIVLQIRADGNNLEKIEQLEFSFRIDLLD